MPRLSEIPHQRHSHRIPLRLKSTASSEANSLHRNAGVERSSKPEDRRFPRTVLEEQKKRGLRMADLEMKLDQTMEELKKLKDQLASAELAKKVVQKKLEKVEKAIVFPQLTTTVQNPVDVDEKEERDKPLSVEKDCDSCITSDVDDIAVTCSEENASQLEAQVMIVETTRSTEKEEDESKSKLLAESPEAQVMIVETTRSTEKEEDESKSKLLAESPEYLDTVMVRAKWAEKEMELATVVAEKESLKKEAEEAKANSSLASKKTKELEIKLAGTEEELKQSKSLAEQLKLKLEAEEVAKTSMQAEMKRLRIQTEQWRKASEAAASILATEDESFRSTQKPLESNNFPVNEILWSPLITGTEVDEGYEGHKKRSSSGGIRVFGDLWKKKGQKK